jgi:hypothetical protein
MKAKRQSAGLESRADPSFDDDVFLQPWYVPKAVYSAIRNILPSVHLAKMRYYFTDYGCLRCERRDVLYGSNGMCENCAARVRSRLVTCLNKRLREVGVADSTTAYESDPVSSARTIVNRKASRPRVSGARLPRT